MNSIEKNNITNAKFLVLDETEDSDTNTSDDILQSKKVEDEGTTGLPATLDTVFINRHPLMVGKVSADIAKIQEELDLDKKLGLTAQAVTTAKESLVKDIDDLTKSNNYMPVSRSILERLFHVKSLQMLCWRTNVQSFIKALFPRCIIPVLMSLAFLAAIPLFVFLTAKAFSGPATWQHVSFCILTVIGWAGVITFGVFAIKQWVDFHIGWDNISVNVVSQELESVTAKIPRGAKLKVLEAQNTGIFESFVYAYPMFNIHRKEIEIKNYLPKINLDPAILGVTKDNRSYMIVYWDVEHDVAHVLQQINDFKKFKMTV